MGPVDSFTQEELRKLGAFRSAELTALIDKTTELAKRPIPVTRFGGKDRASDSVAFSKVNLVWGMIFGYYFFYTKNYNYWFGLLATFTFFSVNFMINKLILIRDNYLIDKEIARVEGITEETWLEWRKIQKEYLNNVDRILNQAVESTENSNPEIAKIEHQDTNFFEIGKLTPIRYYLINRKIAKVKALRQKTWEGWKSSLKALDDQFKKALYLCPSRLNESKKLGPHLKEKKIEVKPIESSKPSVTRRKKARNLNGLKRSTDKVTRGFKERPVLTAPSNLNILGGRLQWSDK